MLRLLYAPQYKIIILRPVILRVQIAYPVKQALLHIEMAHIIGAPQQIKIKIRLEMGLIIFFPIHRHFIFVCVDDFRLREPIQSLHAFIQRVWRQHIVVIREHDVLFLHLL